MYLGVVAKVISGMQGVLVDATGRGPPQSDAKGRTSPRWRGAQIPPSLPMIITMMTDDDDDVDNMSVDQAAAAAGEGVAKDGGWTRGEEEGRTV